MQIATVRHLWGVEVEEWPQAFAKIKENGYYAVETCPDVFPQSGELLLQLCLKHELKLVYQAHTDAYSNYPKKEKSVESHLLCFKKQLENAKNNFGSVLLFVNSHSGYDGWNKEQRELFFSQALEFEKSLPFPVVHETHRSRVLYNPWVTLELVEKFPTLKLTADLSHWYNVLERKLDDEIEIIEKIAPRVHHIHGRVGHSQGPQVPDPNSSLWSQWLESHELCWDTILTIRSKLGEKITYFEPEFGPPPYAWVTLDGKPQVDVWSVCEWVTKREINRYKDKFSIVNHK